MCVCIYIYIYWECRGLSNYVPVLASFGQFFLQFWAVSPAILGSFSGDLHQKTDQKTAPKLPGTLPGAEKSPKKLPKIHPATNSLKNCPKDPQNHLFTVTKTPALTIYIERDIYINEESSQKALNWAIFLGGHNSHNTLVLVRDCSSILWEFQPPRQEKGVPAGSHIPDWLKVGWNTSVLVVLFDNLGHISLTREITQTLHPCDFRSTPAS